MPSFAKRLDWIRTALKIERGEVPINLFEDVQPVLEVLQGGWDRVIQFSEVTHSDLVLGASLYLEPTLGLVTSLSGELNHLDGVMLHQISARNGNTAASIGVATFQGAPGGEVQASNRTVIAGATDRWGVLLGDGTGYPTHPRIVYPGSVLRISLPAMTDGSAVVRVLYSTFPRGVRPL